MRKNLLLVEDDTQMLEELSVIFRANNIRPLLAPTGEASLEIAEKEYFEAALVDVKLPDCSGIDLLTKLRAKRPHSTYILMTAYGSMDSAIQALKNGAQDFVLKPFSPEEIVAAVRKGFEMQEYSRQDQEQVEELRVQLRILEDKMAQMRKLNQLFVGREERVQELKKEINALLSRLGEQPKYEEA